MAVNSISDIVERIRGIDLESALGLRPNWPKVSLALDGREMSVVRLRTPRGTAPVLEAFELRELEEAGVPATLSDQNGSPGNGLLAYLGSAFEALGLRPGPISLVLPDNLAKISLLTLPERPPNRRQLLEVIRFKMHRAVPFRFSEAALSYQIVPVQGPGVSVLVALMRRELVERYEQLLEAVGASPGLIDLCTPNLMNLCRDRIDAASEQGDVALLNCTSNYFSLIIVRGGQLIFFRCKNYRFGSTQPEALRGVLQRELANSFAYYHEKLGGEKIGAVLVRSVATPHEELVDILSEQDVGSVEPIDPVSALTLPAGMSIDRPLGQRLAPAIGAAVGRA
jgi:Tfp pilus assembly PilM family ATPase